MATVITVACQKGGVSKTTSAGILAYLLSDKYKVLCIDTDQQGNLTEMLLQTPIRDRRLEGYLGILDAMKDENPAEYLENLSPNLDLMPGDENAGFFTKYLLQNVPQNKMNIVFKEMLDKLSPDYDYVIIDTAPALSDMLINCLIASDYVLAMYEPSKFCYSAMFSLYETIYSVKPLNPNLSVLGILVNLMDMRRSDNQEFYQLIKSHPEIGKDCLNNYIKRSAATGRLSYAGFYNNPEIEAAVKQYRPVLKEMLERGKKA